MKSSRRNFVFTGGKFGVIAGGLVATGVFAKHAFASKKEVPAKKDEPAKKEELTLIDEKSPMAVTLKYYADAAKAPAALKVAKSGVSGDKQNCANCMFYAKSGEVKGEEIGKCQLFPQGHAPAKAWCSSWTIKPK
jgi:High potential iron-sulfur protein